jgi:alginate O-acetyltransferase complex protein AlgI
MLFSSTVFLFCFLPAVSLIYLLAANRLRNYVLLFFSLLFYAWGEPKYLAVMFFIIGINYISGILMSKKIGRKVVLVLSIFINLASLFFFKYINFFVENTNFFFGTHFTIS